MLYSVLYIFAESQASLKKDKEIKDCIGKITFMQDLLFKTDLDDEVICLSDVY